MKKILSLALSALLLVALLAGCGGGTAEKGIAGSWAADVDMTEYLNAALSAEEDLGKYLTLDSFTIKLLADFNEDGTYSMKGDPDSAKAAMDGLKEQTKAAVTAYMEDMIKEQGLDMSLDELLEASGMSMDDLVDQMDQAYSTEDLLGDLTMEGKYLYEEGKLALSDSLDEEADLSTYEAVELDGDTLTLTGGDDADSDFAGLYPVVFERVG